MKRFVTAALLIVAVIAILGTTGCREAVKRGEIDNLGRKPMFTPVAVPLLQPGDTGELLFWKNGGMFWNLSATINDESHIAVSANQAKMLAKFWGFCSQPGFRKAGQGQPIYWLGSTGLDHDNRLSFVPNQVEVIKRDGWAPAGRVLAEYYKAKLDSQPQHQSCEGTVEFVRSYKNGRTHEITVLTDQDVSFLKEGKTYVKVEVTQQLQ